MKPAIRQLVGILTVTIMLSLLSFWVGRMMNLPESDFALVHAAQIIIGPLDNDSWMPMMQAWRHWTDSGGRAAIYSDLLMGGQLKFQYPPTALLISKLLERFDVNLVAFCHITTLLFFFVTIWATGAVARRSLDDRAPNALAGASAAGFWALVALFVFSFYPIVKAGSLGQIQIWLNALFAISLLCLMTGRMETAGVILGLMAAVKPQYGLFALWGILRGQRRLVVPMLAVTAVLLALGLWEFGIATYVDYLRALKFLAEHGETFYANQSFNGLASRLVSVAQPDAFNNLAWRDLDFPPYDARVYAFTQITSFVVLGIAMLIWRAAGPAALPADFCRLGLAATMASPIAWEHHYGILLPMFALLWPQASFGPDASKQRRVWLFVFFLLSATFLPMFNVLAPTYWNVLQSYLLFAALGTFVLLGRSVYAVTLTPAAARRPNPERKTLPSAERLR